MLVKLFFFRKVKYKDSCSRNTNDFTSRFGKHLCKLYINAKMFTSTMNYSSGSENNDLSQLNVFSKIYEIVLIFFDVPN